MRTRGEGAWAWTRGKYPNAHWGLIAIAWQCTLGINCYSMVGEEILPLPRDSDSPETGSVFVVTT
jgi:hypothetical protein